MLGKARRMLLQRLLVPFSLFSGLMLVGTVGYMVIEHYTFLEAIYITTITISTVGYGEVRPLSDAGHVFTIFLIFLNIGVFSYFISLISQYLIDGDYIRHYKQLKMENRISHMRDHVIICGNGRNGKQASKILLDNHIPFVVIEKLDSETKPSPEQPFILYGDATNDEMLLDAGVKNARAVLSTLPLDTDNLFVVLTAKQLNPQIKIISRATLDTSVDKLKIAGASNVIMPDKIGGAHMASLVLNQDVVEVLSMISTRNNRDFKVVELTVHHANTLEDLDLWKRTGCTILAVKKKNNEYNLNPPAKTKLHQGESLIIMGNEHQIQEAIGLI